MLLETLDTLVEQAGRLTLRYFRTGVAVETKSDMSPVTVADRETEKFLREEILRMFPDDEVIGEEYGTSGPAKSGRTWIIDPIDGTKSFVAQVPIYGVMVGVEENGEVVAGSVGLPALGEVIVAEKGRGCWCNGAKCQVSETSKIEDAILLTTDLANIRKYGRQPAWDALFEKVRYARTWGDCYGHVLVATGRAEIMLDPVMAVWDTAPLPIIMTEAGGKFYDFQGGNSIRNNGAISVNSALSEEVMAIVKTALGPKGEKFPNM